MAENTRPATEWQETDRDQSAEAYEEYCKRKQTGFAKRPPAGRSIWRFLPPVKGKKPVPFIYAWVHFFNNPVNLDELLDVGICQSKQNSKPCELCSYISRLRRSGSEADREVADRLKAKEHVLANVVRLDEDKEQEVSVMDVPKDVHDVLMQILRDKTEGVDFTHPKNGYNVIIERKGEKLQTKYTARLAPRQMPIIKMDWLTQMYDLDQVFGALDGELLKNMLGESSGGQQQAQGVDYTPPEKQLSGRTGMKENPLTGELEPIS